MVAEVVREVSTLSPCLFALPQIQRGKSGGNQEALHSAPHEPHLPCGLMGWGEELHWVWDESDIKGLKMGNQAEILPREMLPSRKEWLSN